MKDQLKSLLDRTLIDGLPRGVKDAIDDLLARGEPKAEILARVRRAAGGKGPLTVAAAEAYLESK